MRCCATWPAALSLRERRRDVNRLSEYNIQFQTFYLYYNEIDYQQLNSSYSKGMLLVVLLSSSDLSAGPRS